MGIMLEWYHLLIGMQTTVLNIVLEVFVVPFFDCMLSSFRFIVHVFIFKIVFENKMLPFYPRKVTPKEKFPMHLAKGNFL